MSAFADILKAVIDRVPGATGAVFVDWEGEAVDQFTELAPLDMQLIGAHMSVVFVLANDRLAELGVGELWIETDTALVLVRRVTDRYSVVLTAKRDAHLATAQRELERGARTLLGEM